MGRGGQQTASDILYGEVGPRGEIALAEDLVDPDWETITLPSQVTEERYQGQLRKVTIGSENARYHLKTSKYAEHIRKQVVTIYLEDDVLHRDPSEGPAKEFADGGYEYYVKGKAHRDDGPAISRANGHQVWYDDGEITRDQADGPAVINSDGSEEYWLDSKRHRTDGPAVTYADGSEAWMIQGQLHRTDGPAITDKTKKRNTYALNGKKFKTKRDWQAALDAQATP